jgi:hypothetical protein
VILILSKNTALKQLAGEFAPGAECYFLSDDYVTLTKIRKQLRPGCDIKTLERDFHETLDRIKDDFLLFCHELYLKNAAINFWEIPLASRNSASVPLLKYLVYFCAAREITANRKSPVIFVCDSLPLARLIAAEAKRQGTQSRIKFSFAESARPFRLYLWIILRAAYYVYKMFIRRARARGLGNRRLTGNDGRQVYMLRSWVTTGSVDKAGVYRDRNFGALPEYLKEQGGDVWTIPMFFNLDRSVPEQMELMSRCAEQFVFPEQYLGFLELLKPLRDGIKNLSLKTDVSFEGRNFGPVIRDIHLDQGLSTELLAQNNIKYLLEKWAAKGIKVHRFVYPMENNCPEKCFILAVKRSYPEAEVIGFQHTVWYREQLGMFLHPVEAGRHPVPDCIVASGKRYIDVLREAGFPAGLIKPGPSLRNSSIHNTPQASGDGGKTGKVLIILNFDDNQTFELLSKAGKALQKAAPAEILIKPHPLTPVNLLQDYLREIKFPPYELVGGTVQQWVVRVDAVIMSGGSVSNLETIIMGVPLIRISLGSNFDLDPLWDDNEFARFSFTPDEIAARIEKCMRLTPAEKEQLRVFGREVLDNYFEPVTPDGMRVFL